MPYDKDQERFDAERYAAQKDTVQREDTARRENTAALSGVTLGILLALAIATAASALFFFNRRIETVPAVPVASPSAAPSVAPEKETIIREEKTRELVPVPQAATPQPSINIIVPSAPSPVAPAPRAESAPSNNDSPSPNPAKTEAPSPTQ